MISNAELSQRQTLRDRGESPDKLDKETTEEFLQRGGRIAKIPRGMSGETFNAFQCTKEAHKDGTVNDPKETK
jgi:hypothetical protein